MHYKSVKYFLILWLFYACSGNDISPVVINELEQNNSLTIDSNAIRKAQVNGWTNWFKKQKYGNLYITNYSLGENIDKQNWAINQDNNNIMLFANRKGILTYDGSELETIKTPPFPYSIFNDKQSGKIYIGCSNSVGYIQKNGEGVYNYIPIVEEPDIGNFVSIVKTGNRLYFASSETIIELNIDNTDEYNVFSAQSPVSGIFTQNGLVFVNSYTNGLMQYKDGELTKFKIAKWQANLPLDTTIVRNLDIEFNLSGLDIIFQLKYNKDNVLLGTSDNNLYLFDGKGFARYDTDAFPYLHENTISGGVNISNTEFAVSTLSGGCVIIEKTTGEIIATINYQTGLPDEEIYSIGLDANKGLWLSHPYGVSRVDLTLPVVSYSSYLGLEGHITAIEQIDTTLYVSTTEGVYYLTEVKDFKEVEVLVEKKKETKRLVPQKTVNIKEDEKSDNESTPVEKQEDNETKKEDKKWLQSKWKKIKRKLFNKDENNNNENENNKDKENNTDNEQTNETDTTKVDNNKKNTQKKKPKTIVKTVVETEIIPEIEYKLQSVSYIYKKVEGIDNKCKQLLKFNDLLLVVTNSGLFEIHNNEATQVLSDTYTNTIVASKKQNTFYTGTNDGLYQLIYNPEENKDKWDIKKIQKKDGLQFNEPVYSIVEMDKAHHLWLGGDNMAYHLKIKNKTTTLFDAYRFYNDFSERIIARKMNNEPVFYLLSGIYGFDSKNDIIYKQILYPDFIPNAKYITSQQNVTWLLKNDNYIALNSNGEESNLELPYFGLFNNIQNIIVDTDNSFWVIDNYSSLYKVITVNNYRTNVFDIYFRSVNQSDGTLLPINSFELDYMNNAVDVSFSAPYFVKTNSTVYKYFISGISTEWSEWEIENSIKYPYIPPGNYTLFIRAKNLFGQFTNIKNLSFSIAPPFWQTWWFYTILSLLAAFLILRIIKIRERRLQMANALLEEKVMKRTEQIRKQKKHITDSISYAGRIQKAILPPKELSEKILPQHFILNLPRDIVSGDYYWFTRKENKVIVVAADCTGHGVPGAFLSMLGVTLLNDIVTKREITTPSLILDQLRDDVMRSLHQTGERGGSKDGMDVAICVLDIEKNILQYAGAHNPLVLFRPNTVEYKDDKTGDVIQTTEYEKIEIKADRMPIGIYLKDRKFTNHELHIYQGDSFYIFSDGYADQFGEEDNRKFYLKRFKKLLLDIQDKPMSLQKQILHETHEKWKGTVEQVDDILVIGVRYGV